MAVKLFTSYFEAGTLAEWSDSSQATWVVDGSGVNHSTAAPYATTYGGPGSTTVQSTTKRSGTYAAKFILKRGDTLFPATNPGGEYRGLINALPGGGTGGNMTGVETWLVASTRVDATTPALQGGWFVLIELHQDGAPVGGGTAYGGPAPFNLDCSVDEIKLIVRGASNPVSTSFFQTVFNLTNPAASSSQGWTPPFTVSQRVLSTVAFTKDVWHDWIFGWKLSGSSSVGWFEAWHKLSTDSAYTQVVQRSSIPTWYDNYRGTFMLDVYRRGYPAFVDVNTATVYIDAVEIWNGTPDQLLTGSTPPTNTVAPVAPSGNTYVGGVLTADTGTWAGTPTSYSYQWVRCDAAGGSAVDIAAATSGTYTLVSADLNKTIRCRIVATNGAGSSAAITSTQTGVISAAPSVTTPTVDAVASAAGSNASSITVPITIAANANLALAWVTDNYTLGNLSTVTLGGQAMILVGAVNDASNSEVGLYKLASPLTGGVNLVVTSTTQRIGNAGVISFIGADTTTPLGALATASGVAAGSPSLSVASVVNDLCVAVICHSSAVSTDPTITDAGTQTNRSSTLATNSNSFAKSRALSATRVATTTSTAFSWTTLPTTNAESAYLGIAVRAAVAVPQNSVAPVVTGNLVQGQTLTCSTGTWAGSPTYTYQWQRDTAGNLVFADIAAATASTRLLAAGDVGTNVRCILTATNASGSTVVTTAYVGIVAPAAPVPQTPPTLTGVASVGQVLTSDTGSWLNLPTSYTYQWRRDGSGNGTYADIGAATSATYTLVSADNLCNVVCVVTGTNATGNASQSSNARRIGVTASRTNLIARTVNAAGRIQGRAKSGTGGGL